MPPDEEEWRNLGLGEARSTIGRRGAIGEVAGNSGESRRTDDGAETSALVLRWGWSDLAFLANLAATEGSMVTQDRGLGLGWGYSNKQEGGRKGEKWKEEPKLDLGERED